MVNLQYGMELLSQTYLHLRASNYLGSGPQNYIFFDPAPWTSLSNSGFVIWHTFEDTELGARAVGTQKAQSQIMVNRNHIMQSTFSSKGVANEGLQDGSSDVAIGQSFRERPIGLLQRGQGQNDI
jgi:hypothetical protein